MPQPLIDQLAVGGRMVIPVGESSWSGQDLMLLEKQEDGTLERKSVMAVRFVPFTGERARSKRPLIGAGQPHHRGRAEKDGPSERVIWLRPPSATPSAR